MLDACVLATRTGAAGELNIGQLVREQYGHDAFLVGFTTYTGTVTAASRWDGPAERKRVRGAGVRHHYSNCGHLASAHSLSLPTIASRPPRARPSQVRPGMAGSVELLFHQVGEPRFLLDLRDRNSAAVQVCMLPRRMCARCQLTICPSLVGGDMVVAVRALGHYPPNTAVSDSLTAPLLLPPRRHCWPPGCTEPLASCEAMHIDPHVIDTCPRHGWKSRMRLRAHTSPPTPLRSYKPQTELQSHYIKSVLPNQYDVIIHVDETRAGEQPLTPTARHDRHPPPATSGALARCSRATAARPRLGGPGRGRRGDVSDGAVTPFAPALTRGMRARGTDWTHTQRSSRSSVQSKSTVVYACPVCFRKASRSAGAMAVLASFVSGWKYSGPAGRGGEDGAVHARRMRRATRRAPPHRARRTALRLTCSWRQQFAVNGYIHHAHGVVHERKGGHVALHATQVLQEGIRLPKADDDLRCGAGVGRGNSHRRAPPHATPRRAVSCGPASPCRIPACLPTTRGSRQSHVQPRRATCESRRALQRGRTRTRTSVYRWCPRVQAALVWQTSRSNDAPVRACARAACPVPGGGTAA